LPPDPDIPNRTRTEGAPDGPRIVSMLASATEIVVALGLESSLVGISHECDYPEHVLDRPRLSRPRFDAARLTSGEIDRAVRDAMARFGSVYEVDAAALEALNPDLILTQAVCEVCAVPTPGIRDLVTATGLDATVLSLDAHTLEDIVRTVIAVGDAAGARPAAERLAAGLRARLNAVENAVAGAARPRVLAIEWLDPPFAPGHWVPEMIEAAGGENLLGVAGGHSEAVTWDELADLDPDVLVVMPCGYGLEASRDDADRFAGQLAEAAPRAIEAGRAWVVDGSSYFNRSGPRAFDGVEILAGLLHPDRFPAPSADAASAWSPARMPDGGAVR
jgi:iron complex transport system substrate-binding protein